MTRWKTWFDNRAPRERWLILIMLVLLAITIVWVAVIRPVEDGLASSRERYDDAVLRLGRTQTTVNASHVIQRGQPQPRGAPLADAVRERAGAAGFTLAGVDTGADSVRTSIASAKGAALLGWLAGLEAVGVLIDAATITTTGDGTVAAQLTLKGRGP